MFDLPPYFADGNTEASPSQRTRAQPDNINPNASDQHWLRIYYSCIPWGNCKLLCARHCAGGLTMNETKSRPHEAVR